jgi:hypothetical protein
MELDFQLHDPALLPRREIAPSPLKTGHDEHQKSSGRLAENKNVILAAEWNNDFSVVKPVA